MRVRCLGDEMSDYAAGRLPLDRQWAWDRHLVACRVCAHAVDAERRLRSALAGAPSMPGDLRSALLALGTAMAADAGPRPVPAAMQDPLRLLAPSAPPCHRSPLRATVVAAAAAGVSAAAAWSLGGRSRAGHGPPRAVDRHDPRGRARPPPRRAPCPCCRRCSPVELTQAVVLARLGRQAESTP